MGKLCEVEGVADVLVKLNEHRRDLGRKVENGLVRAGLTLQALSQKLVPVQFGVLKASAFTRNVASLTSETGGDGWQADVVVGYTANYAVYVHENLEAAHGKEFNVKHAAEIEGAMADGRDTVASGLFYRGEQQQAKFLERPAREARRLLMDTIRAEVTK